MSNGTLSASEKMKIASGFILLTPPGEFNEVFTDVRTLLNNDELLKEHANSTVAKYNKDQFHQVALPDGKMSLITPYNERGFNRFYDPATDTVFVFDHLKKTVSDQTAAGGAEEGGEQQPDSASEKTHEMQPLREAIQSGLIPYVSEYYRNGVGSTFIASSGGGGGGKKELVVCIESHYVKQFLTGRWRSEWHLEFSSTKLSGTVNVKGTVKIQTHLFEDGNVQCISSNDESTSINFTSGDDLSKKFIKFISDFDNNYQRIMSDNFKQMSDSTFKSLRRALPISQTKIDWNKLSSYTIGGNLFQQGNSAGGASD